MRKLLKVLIAFSNLLIAFEKNHALSISCLIAAPESEWNKVLINHLSGGKGDISPDELYAVIKKRIERTLIRTVCILSCLNLPFPVQFQKHSVIKVLNVFVNVHRREVLINSVFLSSF